MENIKQMTFNELQILYNEIGEELEKRKCEELTSLKEELRSILKEIKKIDSNYVLFSNYQGIFDVEDLLELL